jgi:hypothetical protein
MFFFFHTIVCFVSASVLFERSSNLIQSDFVFHIENSDPSCKAIL